jgi:predicted RNA methylase
MLHLVLAIILITIEILLLLALIFLGLATLTGAPFVPSHQKALKDIVGLAQIKKGETVYDLGSGDGRILIEAAKKGARSFGWEINPFLWLISKIKIRLLGLQKNVKVYWGNFWTQDLSKADVIFFFLITYWMKTLEKKILKEARVGTKIIAYIFPLPTLKPLKKTKTGVYFYKITQNDKIKSDLIKSVDCDG